MGKSAEELANSGQIPLNSKAVTPILVTNLRRHCASLTLVILLWVAAACLTAPSRRPNILLAISDDQSFPHASAYGASGLATPAFDRVARAGVLFTNAFVASPGCSPSRAALLTGLYPWQLEHAGTHASSFSVRFDVYPDLLEAAGYFVGFTGKGWGPGNWEAGGRKRNPAGPEFNQRRLDAAPEGIRDKDYFANFQDFLEAKPSDRPFAFWFGAHEPHRVFGLHSGTRSGKKLEDYLTQTGDPRMSPDGEIFETYRRYSRIREFPPQ